MARKISRKSKGVRRQARAQGTRRQMQKARASTGSAFDRLMRMLPFTEEQLHTFFTVLILAGAAALAWAVASYAGAVQLVEARFAALASDAGYEVRRVEVRGVERMNELKVYERALGERERAMTRVDLGALRESLLELPWVQDARVSRQLPDGLVIDIVEREPHAVLRRAGRLALIDAGGHILEPIAPGDVGDRLLIEGPGAQDRVADLERLLEAAPALRPQVTSAEWVGNRRWNLTFRTEQRLALPQGEDRAAGALISFARLDGVNRLLGGKVAAFDMRTPERIYMRVPGRAEEAMALKEGS